MVLTVTTNFLESKNCTKKVLISHESYDKFNHLNTVNSFHKLIEERLQKYKGVASKYINRYNAFFFMQKREREDNTKKSQSTSSLIFQNIYPITPIYKLNKWLVLGLKRKTKYKKPQIAS